MTVTPLTVDERLISVDATRDEEWMWNVTAVRPGSHTLTLTLLVELENGKHPLSLATIEKTISVHALPAYAAVLNYLHDNPKVVMSLFLLPAFRLARGLVRKPVRKRSGADAHPTHQNGSPRRKRVSPSPRGSARGR